MSPQSLLKVHTTEKRFTPAVPGCFYNFKSVTNSKNKSLQDTSVELFLKKPSSSSAGTSQEILS